MTQQHGLTWGALDFVSEEPTAAGYLLEACADGTNFGNPKALIQTVRSLLTDGSLAVLEGWDNREIPIHLRISAPSAIAGPALAAAEAALMAELRAESKSPLVYTPPATDAPASYFDVVVAELERDNGNDWDFDESQREERYYVLTLTCLPFARPSNSVVVPAAAVIPPTPVIEDVDTCDATTGWSTESAGFGPVVRTNLVTNPSFETNTSGWTLGSLASSITRSSASPLANQVGTYVAYVHQSGGVYPSRSYANSAAMPATAGKRYAIQARFYEPGGYGFLVRFFSGPGGTGSMLQETDTLRSSPPPGLQMNTESSVHTAPAGTASMQIYPYGVGEDGTVWALDAVMVEESDAVNSYFDGDTIDTSVWIYAWSGTAHASTSTATSTTPATSLSATAGHVDLTGSAMLLYSGTRTLSLVRSGSVAMTGTPYLRISASLSVASGAAALGFKVGTGGAATAPILAAIPSDIPGYTDYYINASGGFDTLLIEATAGGAPNEPSVAISVAHVARTDTVPSSATTRAQARTAEVAGSAPTQAAVRLFDATPAALGTEIMVHTSRNTAWKPALRPYRTDSDDVTTDSTMVSGGRNTLASAMVFRIPANLLTEGTYSLMARLNVGVAGTIGWSAKTVSSAGATTVGSSVVTSGSATVGVTDGYQVINLAALPLPVVKAEADQMVELTLTGTSNMTVDEAWLFGLHDGVLTWLRDTDSLTWIEIRSPELGAARPSIYGGTGAKGANSIDVSWKAAGGSFGSFGAHRFDPGLMQIFTVTSSSLVSQSEIEFYPRYHSHVEAA